MPFGDSLRHVSTALLSCSLVCGENAGVGAGGACLSLGHGGKFYRKSEERDPRIIAGRVRMTFMLNYIFAHAPLQDFIIILIRSM